MNPAFAPFQSALEPVTDSGNYSKSPHRCTEPEAPWSVHRQPPSPCINAGPVISVELVSSADSVLSVSGADVGLKRESQRRRRLWRLATYVGIAGGVPLVANPRWPALRRLQHPEHQLGARGPVPAVLRGARRRLRRVHPLRAPIAAHRLPPGADRRPAERRRRHRGGQGRGHPFDQPLPRAQDVRGRDGRHAATRAAVRGPARHRQDPHREGDGGRGRRAVPVRLRHVVPVDVLRRDGGQDSFVLQGVAQDRAGRGRRDRLHRGDRRDRRDPQRHEHDARSPNSSKSVQCCGSLEGLPSSFLQRRSGTGRSTTPSAKASVASSTSCWCRCSRSTSRMGMQKFWGARANGVNKFLPAHRQMPRPKPQHANILLIAATNRAESLDPALLRPGRFDRALTFNVPDQQGRRALADHFLVKKSHHARARRRRATRRPRERHPGLHAGDDRAAFRRGAGQRGPPR